jgi:hypothetical protein
VGHGAREGFGDAGVHLVEGAGGVHFGEPFGVVGNGFDGGEDRLDFAFDDAGERREHLAHGVGEEITALLWGGGGGKGGGGRDGR